MLKIIKNGKVIDLSKSIKLNSNDKVLIVDDVTGLSPQKIKVLKKGKKLHIVDEASGDDLAVIENYYEVQESVTVYGMTGEGSANEFIYYFDESDTIMMLSSISIEETISLAAVTGLFVGGSMDMMQNSHNNDNTTNTTPTTDKIVHFDSLNPPSRQDYLDAGIDIKTATNDDEAFNLLTDILKETTPTFTDISDAKTQIEHIADIVDKIMDIANGGTSDLTVQDLTDIGLTDADLSGKLTTLKAAIDATDDSGTGVDTQAELQSLIDGITNVSGSVTLGPVIENNTLSVEAYTSTGELYGTAKVNADGTFSFLSYTEYSGTLLIRVVDSSDDADYLDESTGLEKDLTTDIRAVTVLSGFGDYSVNITPLTELATIKMGVTDTTPPTNTTAVDATNKAVATLFGVTDIINTQPVAINDTKFDDAEAASKQYGEVLAALSGMDQDNGGSVGDTLAILNDAITSSVEDLSTVQSADEVSFAWKLDLSGTQGQDALSSGAANANVANAILTKILKADIAIDENGKTVIKGVTASGISVDVTFPDGTKQSTISAADGSFEIISDNIQPEGDVIIESFDEDGNPLASSKGVVDENTTSSDTTGPTNPSVNLEVNSDGKVVVKGATEAGAKITVTLPDGTTQTTTADIDGNYELISNTTQPLGDVKVIATDASGNPSAEITEAYDTQTSSLDETPPVTPEILVKTASDGKVIVKGTAEAGSTVEVTFPDNTTKTVLADKDGNFEFISDTIQTTGTISVTATDTTGNESTPAEKTYQITITDVTAQIDEDGHIIITGKAPAGEIMEVTFPDGTKGEGAADENGNFTVTSDGPQPEGEFIVDGGDSSPVKGKIDDNTASSDITPPANPTLTVTVNTLGKLVIGGTAEAGSKVEITLPDGTTKATVTAGTDGNFTYTSTSAQPFGDTKVNATDASGNTSEDTTVAYSTTTTSLDTTPPTKPTIGLSVDATGHLVIKGKSEPYTKVTLTLPNGTTATTTTDKDGSYTYTTPTTQPLGSVKAIATDLSGNNSATTIVLYSTTTTTADHTAPDTPTVTMKIESDKKMTLSGNAEAGSSVEVTFPDNTKKTVIADKDGNYSATSTAEQANSGTYSALAKDASGNSSTSTSHTYEITISGLTPTIKEDGTIIITGKGPVNELMEVTFPDGTKKEVTSDGEGNFEVTSDEPQPSGEIIVDTTDGTPVKTKIDGTTNSLDETAPDAPTIIVAINSTGKLVISGTAEAGSKVTLTLPNGTTQTTTADTNGNYTYTTTTVQPFGDVKAKATDVSGNASGETIESYSLANIYSTTNTDGTIISSDITAPNAPTLTLSTQIDGKVAVKGKTESLSSVTVTFTDGTTKTVTADKDGNYSTISNTTLPIGTIKANATDLSGNKSADGEATYQTGSTFTSDIKAPNAPTIILEVNTDGKLVVKGLSESGSKVEITLPDGTKQTTTADKDGNYTYTSTTLQPFGSVKVSATDASGNKSKEATKEYSELKVITDTNPNGEIISHDTTAPDSPTVTMNIASDKKITLQGTSEIGSTIEVTFADGTKKTVIADKDGNFSVTSDSAQPTPNGTNTIIAKDSSGNASDAVEKSYIISITELKAQIDPDGKIIVTGKAPAGKTMEVTFPDGTKGEGTADEEGNFEVTSDGPQPGGEVIVDMGDGSPAKLIIDGTTTSLDETAPEIPTLTVTVNSTGKLVISGTAEEGSKVTLTLPNGTTQTTTADTNGNYTYTTTTVQPFGDVKAKATDVSGNESGEATKTYNAANIQSTTNPTGEIISSDTTAPDKPTATLKTTRDGLLTIDGKAEALSFVTIKFTDGTSKVVQADELGVFTATSDTKQPTGNVKLSAKDASGNSSAETSLSYGLINNISLDNTPPQTPTITAEVNTTGKLVISGTSEIGTTVAITLPDGTIKTAITGLNGTYSYTATTTQPFGNLKANAMDASGNKSGDATASYSTTTTSQDSTPPAAPIVLLYGTEEGLLSVKGKVEAYSTVTITFIDGTQKTVQSNQNGAYEATSDAPQSSGQVKAYTVDLSGNKSADGVASYDANSLSYDTTPPQDPTVVLAAIEGKLKVSGEAEIGSTVTVTFPDGSTKDVIANSEGIYLAISDTTQNDGDVTVYSKDVTGNKSQEVSENFVATQTPTDTTAPKATITLSDSALTVGETATVTITFSEEVTGFELADLTAQNGILSNLQVTSDAKVYTATFTPTADISDATNVITLATTYTDIATNAGITATSANYTVDTTSTTGGGDTGGTGTTDTTAPTATIALSDSALTVGETATVTITFSEEVTGFELADLTAENGTLSSLQVTSDAKVYTATFTPTADISDATNVITLATTYTDIATNAGTTATSANYTVDTTSTTGGGDTGGTGTTDTTAPTATITLSDSTLTVGETATVTITFSEEVTAFELADLTAENGTLTNLVKSTSDAKVYTATFTPTANISDATNVITLATTYTDIATNAGTVSSSANYTVDTTTTTGGGDTGGTGTTDTTAPTATITLSDSTLTVGETATVTITFSEEVTAFELADLTAENGTLTDLVKSTTDAKVYTATFTPTANISDATNVITLATTYTDIATNTGTVSSSANYTVDTTTTTGGGTGTTDTTAPTAVITLSDSTLTVGETATVTITFSEEVTAFELADLTAENGTLSSLQVTSDAKVYTATFTPTANISDTTNVITLATTYKDLANNDGTTATSANYTVDTTTTTGGGTGGTGTTDTTAPTATITLSDSALTVGETATVTITFSEEVTFSSLIGGTFDIRLLNAQNGTLSNLVQSSTDSKIYTATLTPNANVNTAENVVTFMGGYYTDAAGNVGLGATSTNYSVKTVVHTETTYLELQSDSNIAGDFITNFKTVNVVGLSGDWQYSTDNGSTWIDGSGTSFEVADGVYASKVIQAKDSATTIYLETPKVEDIVNTTTAGNQTYSTITKLSNGGYVVAWVDNNSSVAVQVYDANNAKVGSETKYTTNSYAKPSIVEFSNGKFAVVDASQGSIQLFNSDGTIDGSLIATYKSQNVAEVINDKIFMVYSQGSWDSATSSNINVLKANFYNSTTNSFDSTTELTLSSVASKAMITPKISKLADGYLVSWTQTVGDGTATDFELHAQKIDTTGAKVGSEVTLVNDINSFLMTNYNSLQPINAFDVIQLSSTQYLATWYSNNGVTSGTSTASANYDVYAQIFNISDNSAVGNVFQANTTTTGSQSAPSATVLSDGSFIIAWSGNGAGDTVGVFTQKYSADGTAIGGETLVNGTVAGSQYQSDIIATNDGGYVVSWSGAGNGDSVGVFKQAYDASGAKIGGSSPSIVFDSVAPTAPTLSIVAGYLKITSGEAGLSYQLSTDSGTTWMNIGTQTQYKLTDGTYADGQFQVKATDIAGNVSTTAKTSGTVIVDSVAPSAPTMTFDINTETSTSSSTYLKTGTVTVGGLEEGATWEYQLNSGSWVTGTGTTFTITDGTYYSWNIQVRQKDTAGNVSQNAYNNTTYYFDITPPAMPTISLYSDTAAINTTPYTTDGITNNGKISLGGSIQTYNGEYREYTLDGGTTWTQTTSSEFTLAEGSYSANSVGVRSGDASGNKSEIAYITKDLVIDKTAPTADVMTLSGMTLSFGSDAASISYTQNGWSWSTLEYLQSTTYLWSQYGISSIDATNKTITFSKDQSAGAFKFKVKDLAGNESAELSSPVVADSSPLAQPYDIVTRINSNGTVEINGKLDQYYLNNTNTTLTITFSDGSTKTYTNWYGSKNFYVTSDKPLPDGDITLVATNGTRSSESLVVGLYDSTDTISDPTTYDTTPPASLSASHQEADGKLQITGTTEAGAKVTVTLPSGATKSGFADTSGNYTITSDSAESSGYYSVQASDLSGNTTPVVTKLYFSSTGDILDAVVTIDSISADTGYSNSDFITKVSAQTLSATLSRALTDGEKLYAKQDNGSLEDITSKVSGTTVTWDGLTLALGSGSFELKVSNDVKDGLVATQAYSYDNTASTTALVDDSIVIVNDGGVSSTDSIITTGNFKITATLDNALAEGDKVIITTDGGTTWSDITSNTIGTAISTANTGVAVGAGATNIEIRVEDAAGNTSDTITKTITVDSTQPDVPTLAVSENSPYLKVTNLETNGWWEYNIDTMGYGDFDSNSYITVKNGDKVLLPTQELIYGFHVRQMDVAGNWSAWKVYTVGELTNYELSELYIQPGLVTTTVTIDSLAHDSGSSSTDFITNVQNNTIYATLSEALKEEEIVVFEISSRDAQGYLTTKTYTNATIINDTEVTLNATLYAGTDFTIKAYVKNNNEGTTGEIASQVYIFDNTNPSVSVVGSSIAFGETADSSGATDWYNTSLLSSKQSQTISATLSGELGTEYSLEASLDGGTTWKDISSYVSGTTLTWTEVSLQSSGGQIIFKMTEPLSGNEGYYTSKNYIYSAGLAHDYTLTSFSISDDTGNGTTGSNSDLITREQIQTITITLNEQLASSEKLQVSYDGGSTWRDSFTTDGTFNINGTSISGNYYLNSNGAYNMTFRVIDPIGNEIDLGTRTITLDKIPPTATIDTLAGSASATPVITGTANKVGVVVTVEIGGATYEVTTDVNKEWSIDTATATPILGSLTLNTSGANNTIKVTSAVDIAGNTTYFDSYNNNEIVQTLYIDATTPQALLAVRFYDTGMYHYDYVTNNNTLVVDGLQSGFKWQYSLDNGETWSTPTDTSTITGLSTNKTYAIGDIQVRQINLVDIVSDVISNVNAWTLDGIAPNEVVITSSNFTNSKTPLITGTAEANSLVEITVDGVSGKFAAITDTDGNWSLNLISTGIGSTFYSTDKDYALSIVAKDLAGNASNAVTQILQVDATPPSTPSFTLQDTGLKVQTTELSIDYTDDNITNNNTLTISGLETGAKWQYSLNSGSTWSNWFDTDTTTFNMDSDTSYAIGAIQVRQKDTFENISAIGSNSAIIVEDSSINVTLSSPTVINTWTPILTGTVEKYVSLNIGVHLNGATNPNSYFPADSYEKNGTQLIEVDEDGNWSLDLTNNSITQYPTSDGSFDLIYYITDLAGNTSNGVIRNNIVVDVHNPVTPIISYTDSIDGVYDTNMMIHNITNGLTKNNTLTVSNLRDSDQAATPTTWRYTLDGGSTWSGWQEATITTFTIGHNTTYEANKIGVQSKDIAGNIIVSHYIPFSLTEDSIAPAVAITSNTSTNDTTPTISGTAEAGAIINLTIAEATYQVTATNGTWSVDTGTTPISGTLSINPNGENSVSVTATDTAGNVSAPITQALTVDTTPPAVAITSNTSTNDTTPIISGTAEAGAIINLTIAEVTYQVTVTDGTWSVDTGTTPTSGTLSINPNGENSVSVTATDAVGNTSAAVTQVLTVDTTTPIGSYPWKNNKILEATGVTGQTDYSPQITAIGTLGEYVITYYGTDTDGDTSVYVQKFNADGTINGEQVKLEATGVTDKNDYNPQITAIGTSGKYVVTYVGMTSNNNTSIFIQKFNADGTKDGSQIAIGNGWYHDDYTFKPAIASVGTSGDLIVVYKGIYGDIGSGTVYSPTVFIQKISANGTTIDLLRRDPYDDNDNVHDYEIQITTVGTSGDFVVTYDTAIDGIYVEKYNAYSEADSSKVELKETVVIDGNNSGTKITAIGTLGEYVITYYGTDTDGDTSVYVQKFKADGTVDGNQVKLEATGVTNKDDFNPQITALGESGEFVVTYLAKRETDSSYYDVYVQKFHADGTIDGNQVKLEASGAIEYGGYDLTPQITAIGTSGEFVVTYVGDNNAGGYNVFIQRFNADGTINGNQVNLKNTATGTSDKLPQVTAVGTSGEFVVTYQGTHEEGTDSIYVQKFNADGTMVEDLAPTISSNELGTGYMVYNSIAVNSLDDILNAPDDKMNSVAITTINTATAINTTGLLKGTYNFYVADEAGNISQITGATYSTTPIMLDLNNDGVHTTSLDTSNIVFDIDANGVSNKTGWSDGIDGFLVLDLNNDGIINDGSELFGSGTTLEDGSKAQDGYEALRQYDENGDNLIDINDLIFNSLQIWVDTNIDGKTDNDELHTLASLGIASLDLLAKESNQMDNGNTLGLVSSWTDTTGETQTMADVWFVAQNNTEHGINPEPVTYTVI